jgi:hypothetical protein
MPCPVCNKTDPGDLDDPPEIPEGFIPDASAGDEHAFKPATAPL